MVAEEVVAEDVVVVKEADSLLTVVPVLAVEGEAEDVVVTGPHPLPGLLKLVNIPVRNGTIYLIGNSNV